MTGVEKHVRHTDEDRQNPQDRYSPAGAVVVAVVVGLLFAALAGWGIAVAADALLGEPEKMTSFGILLGIVVVVLAATPLTYAVLYLRRRTGGMFRGLMISTLVVVLVVTVVWAVLYG